MEQLDDNVGKFPREEHDCPCYSGPHSTAGLQSIQEVLKTEMRDIEHGYEEDVNGDL